MKMNLFYGMAVAVLLAACAPARKTAAPTVAPYGSTVQVPGQSALVYGLPQTRLHFEVELVKTVVRRGPYAEYANRMLGLQNVPMRDSESWQIRSIRIGNRQEVDSRQLYAVSFIDYPQNIDRLLRFTGSGLIMDLSAGNVSVMRHVQGTSGDDFQFVNATVRNTVTEKVDTVVKTILTDTAFVRIPVLQRKMMSKTTEEQAREAAQQIFNIRQSRLDVLTGNTDYHPDGAALKLVLQSLDMQEEQLLSLFNGISQESRQVVNYAVLPEKPATSAELFYFSERSGIVARGTAGAKPVWYEMGKIAAPASVATDRQADNLIYYRIPLVVEVSAGVDRTTLVREPMTVCQFGSIVSFPLTASPAK